MIKHQMFVNKHLPVQTQRKINISTRHSIDVIIVLILSLFDMILVCTLVVLLFIPLAKWYKKQRFKAQHSTLSNNLLRILQKLQINFFKKTLWMVTDISLKSVT